MTVGQGLHFELRPFSPHLREEVEDEVGTGGDGVTKGGEKGGGVAKDGGQGGGERQGGGRVDGGMKVLSPSSRVKKLWMWSRRYLGGQPPHGLLLTPPHLGGTRAAAMAGLRLGEWESLSVWRTQEDNMMPSHPRSF